MVRDHPNVDAAVGAMHASGEQPAVRGELAAPCQSRYRGFIRRGVVIESLESRRLASAAPGGRSTLLVGSSIQRGRPNERNACRPTRCLLDAGSLVDRDGLRLGAASAPGDRRVAEGRLSSAAKAAIKELLIPPDTLPDVAGWADKEGHDAVPGSAKWHFINVPIGDTKFDPRLIRDENNVVVKIKQYRKILSDRSRPKKERQRALLFLVHFVSDIHQPLHVGDHHDHGGNDTQIRFFDEGTNLHKLWDSDLIHRIGGDDRAWASRLEREIVPETIKEWSTGSVDDWADESLQVAKLAYRPLEDAPKIIPRGYRLGEPYLERAEPILKKQMARASVRLANELNAIFK